MCQVTVNVNAPDPEARPSVAIPWEESKRLILDWNAARKRPRPLCRHCGCPFRGADGGILRKRLCTSCESRWLDRIVQRLIKRHGRKGTVRLLRAIAPK